MYRGPGGPASRGRSKATASTVCQKCLKRGHYSYECTVSAQERPYKARPSRTQQLLNPNLKPKLTTEVPNDLLRKKGIADELLAKNEEDRGRTRSPNGDRSSRKRSFSTSSSDSVSTISTTRSRSRSPGSTHHRHKESRIRGHTGRDGTPRKRERSMSSSSSDTSGHSEKRNVRRRLSSFSPPERGRSRSFSHEAKERKGRRSRSRSISRRRRRPRSRNRSRAYRGDDAIRSLSRSRSRSVDRMDTSEETKHWYNDKNADGYGSAQRASLYRSAESPSRSPSPRKRDVRKSPVYGRRSPSPYAGRGPRRSPSVSHWQNNANDRYGYRGGKNTVLEERSSERAVPAAPPPQRERSLSPYSKRVALTKAMQGR